MLKVIADHGHFFTSRGYETASETPYAYFLKNQSIKTVCLKLFMIECLVKCRRGDFVL